MLLALAGLAAGLAWLPAGPPDRSDDARVARTRLELDTIRRYVVMSPPDRDGATHLIIRRRPRELDCVRDPWGRPYRSDVALGIAFTLGRDGQPGGYGPDADAWVRFRPRLQLASVAVPVTVDNPSARADRLVLRFTKPFHPGALRSGAVTRALVMAENTDYWREPTRQWRSLEDRFPGFWRVETAASSAEEGVLVLVPRDGQDCPIIPSELWLDLAAGQQVFLVAPTGGSVALVTAQDHRPPTLDCAGLPEGFDESAGIPAESGRGVPVRFEP